MFCMLSFNITLQMFYFSMYLIKFPRISLDSIYISLVLCVSKAMQINKNIPKLQTGPLKSWFKTKVTWCLTASDRSKCSSEKHYEFLNLHTKLIDVIHLTENSSNSPLISFCYVRFTLLQKKGYTHTAMCMLLIFVPMMVMQCTEKCCAEIY